MAKIEIIDKVYAVRIPFLGIRNEVEEWGTEYSVNEIDVTDGYVIRIMPGGSYYYQYPEGGWDLNGSPDCYSDDIDTGKDCYSNYDFSIKGELYFYSDKEAAEAKVKELNEGLQQWD